MKHSQHIFHLFSFATRPVRSSVSLKPEERREQRSPYQHTLVPIALVCSIMSVSLSCANDQLAWPNPEKPVTQDPQIKKYETYFKGLNLPYMKPLGCSRTTPCQLVADFNDDGTEDLVGLYEYSGPKQRSNAWYLDLVIIYSTKDSAGPKHTIFTHVGRLDSKNQVLAKLETQEVGDMKLPLRTFKMQRPGINVMTKGQSPEAYFPTYYWNGKEFHAIVKAAD